MSAISTTQHLGFLHSVRKELAVPGITRVPEQLALQDKQIGQLLQKMEELHNEYHNQVKLMISLIQEYESSKKQARILLRKRIAAHKKQVLKNAGQLNQVMGKAS